MRHPCSLTFPASSHRGYNALEMSPGIQRFGFGLKGSAALFVAIAVVVILLIAFPAYRLFFLLSVLIGIVIAAGLTVWHRLRPIKDEDVEKKRPLGL